jgi:hypothetical protein
MAEQNSKRQQNPTAEELAGVTIVIESDEDLTVRPGQIPPQQLPPTENGSSQVPGEHYLFIEGEERVLVKKPVRDNRKNGCGKGGTEG